MLISFGPLSNVVDPCVVLQSPAHLKARQSLRRFNIQHSLSRTFILLLSKMTAGSPDPGDDVQPHPEQTVETILRGMEKKSDDFPLEGQTRLADIGFVKEDFENFKTYVQGLVGMTELTGFPGTARTRSTSS